MNSPYDNLVQAFEAQEPTIARFVPSAFHVHSVDSFDWGKEADCQLNDGAQFAGPDGQDRFLQALVDAGLALVCITDHMKSGYACELAARAMTRDDITVLPGMEVSCSVDPGHHDFIHVLVVYPPGTTPDVIDRIFADQPELPGEARRNGHEHARFGSLAEVARRVDAAEGMFILAHVDQEERGHRAYVRSQRGMTAQMFGVDPDGRETIQTISHQYADYLVALNPHAVEVMHTADRQHYFDFNTADGVTHRYPGIARSDHHSVEAFALPDARTYVKVSRRDMRCVRDALRFHPTRIRFADDLPAVPSPRLIGLRIRGAGDGLFADATIAFSENLNCLIGPRGSGKSTIVEALRYVLGQRGLLEEAAERAEDGASFAQLALATQEANLADCEIEAIYDISGERRVLVAAFDPSQPLNTRVFGLDGSDCHVQAAAVSDAFPARIFSWSELETLGRRPSLQRTVVDRLVDGLGELVERRTALRAALAANRRDLAALQAELERLMAAEAGTLKRFSEHRAHFERLNTDEVAALFADLDRARERARAVDTATHELDALAEALSALSDVRLDVVLAEHIAGGGEELRAWWQERVEPALALDALASHARAAAASVAAEIETRRARLAALRSELQGAADRADAALRERTQPDPGQSVQRDQREQARQRFERSNALRGEYLAVYARFDSDRGRRAKLLAELAEARSEIAQARATTADELAGRLAEFGRSGPVTIEVAPGGDRDAWITYLDGFLNPDRGGQYRARGLARRLARIAPTDLAAAITARDAASIAAAAGVTEEEARRLVSAFALLVVHEGAQVTVVAEEFDEVCVLEEQPVEDLVTIHADRQRVDELSPGGRSSAMLPLIALSDKVPLIIDQPEDNLDNRMVGQTLSDILAKLKEQRQIIVTTHNPNIVVGGDAEQVAVLDAPTNRSATVEMTGSIDDDAVIEAVIAIMEGGAEAFDERRRRYEDHLA
jgi:ABC-type cobalamin/Fe3+-siderophores transport system ATPase subunit